MANKQQEKDMYLAIGYGIALLLILPVVLVGWKSYKIYETASQKALLASFLLFATFNVSAFTQYILSYLVWDDDVASLAFSYHNNINLLLFTLASLIFGAALIERLIVISPTGERTQSIRRLHGLNICLRSVTAVAFIVTSVQIEWARRYKFELYAVSGVNAVFSVATDFWWRAVFIGDPCKSSAMMKTNTMRKQRR